jgi:hypothetical protein
LETAEITTNESLLNLVKEKRLKSKIANGKLENKSPSELLDEFEPPNLDKLLDRAGLLYDQVIEPDVGPPKDILDLSPDWETFKTGYLDYLDHNTHLIDRIVSHIVEATAQDLLPIVFCPCPLFPGSFGKLSASEKDIFGCHKFLLTNRLRQRFSQFGTILFTANLDPNAFWK